MNNQRPIRNEFIACFVLILLLGFILAFDLTLGLIFPLQILQVIVGLPYILFIPGYFIHLALFPEADTLDNYERIASSFGFSLALIPILALILNALPFGISGLPIFIIELISISLVAIIALLRRRSVPEDKRFYITLPSRFSLNFPSDRSTKLAIFGIMLCIALVLLSALTIFISSFSTNYTEFYILNADGQAENYPRELILGESASVILVVINREGEPSDFSIRVMDSDNQLIGEADIPLLENDEQWRGSISFSARSLPSDNWLRFELYRDNLPQIPYLSLRLWVEISQ